MVLRRATIEFCWGIGGTVQQVCAFGICMPPHSTADFGRQHPCPNMSFAGARQAMAGAASMTSARTTTPPVRNDAILQQSLCPRAELGQVTDAQVNVI